MSYDELELEAMIQEVLEDCGDFENLDDEELFELIEKIKELTKPSRKAPSFSYGDIRLSQKN